MTTQITQTGENLTVDFTSFGIEDYEVFLKCKRLPESKIVFDENTFNYRVETHSRYANLLGIEAGHQTLDTLPLSSFLFEHQREILKLALAAKSYAVWANVGLGKTLIELEFARQVSHITAGGRVLIFTLNEIVDQTIEECEKFYKDSLPLLKLESRDEMRLWAKGEFKPEYKIAITNYEKMNPDKESGQIVSELKNLAGIILDESSRLKAGGGKQKWALIKSSKGIPYKLSCTATPAPNDYIEFASQASFLERMRDEKEIIWSFFVRDKVTNEWTVKRHAREAFFEWMAAWSIYLKLPQSFGWSSDFVLPPEPEIIRHEIPITAEQLEKSRLFNVDMRSQPSLFVQQSQGIVGRSKMSQIAKGFVYLDGKKKLERIESHKPRKVADLICQDVSDGLQVLVWTIFDEETEIIAEKLNESGLQGFEVLTGSTSKTKRQPMLDNFRRGDTPVLISKASLLGYGMNFQMCGSMIFSGWNDSFESFYQAVGRAVRYGQQKSVKIHLPFIRELEFAQLENVFRKQSQFETAILEQEKAYIKAMQNLKLLN